MTPHTAPQLGSGTYIRDRFFNSTVTDNDEKREVMLPNWVTPMAEALCEHLYTPQEAAKHIRAGVERTYQTTDIGDGYIDGAGCDLTITQEEEDRRNRVKTDNSRIKMVSPANDALVPFVLTIYHVVCNRMYGEEMSGAAFTKERRESAKMLHNWYTCNAKEFLKKPMSEWESMEWYQNVPKDAPKPQHPLQERDANAQSEAADQNSGEKKRGTKRPSQASSGKDGGSNSKAAKKDVNHVYTADELSDIPLEGEDTEEAPIFETCNDIRRKLNDTLKHTSQANMARQLDAVIPNSSVNTKQLRKFLDFKGVQDGAHSIAFYAAYVYFEKVRIKDGKRKGKKREKMEQIWGGPRRSKDGLSLTWHDKGSPLGGFPREGRHKASMLMPAGDNWTMDQYGQVIIMRRNGKTTVE